jgi:sulfite exporter TauE/SafE
MQEYLLAFVTGLTAGGLSCLAVQGGLLASSLASQVERDVLDPARRKNPHSMSTKSTLTILLFLGAKLVAYTFLGALLGLAGSVITFSPFARAILLIAIGIFMVGNALRMLNVHPIFRYFAIVPPRFITRYIRKRARNNVDYFSPLFLGALTVFIPCGVTQAMMAVALATGNPIQGAALMFAFILGSSPVFFLVSFLTMQISQRLEKWFYRAIGITVLVFGLISVNSGFNVMGIPLFPQRSPIAAEVDPISPTSLAASDSVLELLAQNNGYFPERLAAPADVPLTLNVVTENTVSCSRAFLVPSLGVQVILPETGVVPISIPAQPAGTVLPFTCSMGMYTGEIVFGD